MTLTRRFVLKAGLTAGAGVMTAPWELVALGETITRTRFSATSPQGQAMLVKYAKAVGLMMDPTKYPTTDPRSWSFQWYTHWVPGPLAPWSAVAAAKETMLEDDCEHGNPGDPNVFQEEYFCVWHRHFVHNFEDVVRSVLNDQTFTLPYWDYLSGNVSDLSIPPEFRDQGSPLYRANRNPWVNAGERIDKQNPGSINLNALKEPIYIDAPDGSQGFCPILDSNPHGLVHVFVGNTTNMGRIPFAANDPIFWLHHANIDRLWESWSRLPNRSNPNWPSRAFSFADGHGKEVNVVAAEASRTELLNYEYDSYAKPAAGRLPLPSRPTSLGATDSISRVMRAFASQPVTLGTDRVRVDLAPVTSSADGSIESTFAVSSPSRPLYLVLGGLSASGEVASTYNVFMELPEAAANAGPDHPHFVGTLHFFGAAGHDRHGLPAQRVVFNVTDKVRGLMTNNALTATPSVTLVRHGDPEREKPTIGQVVLIEG